MQTLTLLMSFILTLSAMAQIRVNSNGVGGSTITLQESGGHNAVPSSQTLLSDPSVQKSIDAVILDNYVSSQNQTIIGIDLSKPPGQRRQRYTPEQLAAPENTHVYLQRPRWEDQPAGNVRNNRRGLGSMWIDPANTINDLVSPQNPTECSVVPPLATSGNALDQLPVDFDEICSFPVAERNGRACGYDMSFSMSEIVDMCKARNALVDDTETVPAYIKGCHTSNCTTASFLGIINLLKTRDNFEAMKDELKCKLSGNQFRGWWPVYNPYKEAYGLRTMTEYLNENFDLGAEHQSISLSNGGRRLNQDLDQLNALSKEVPPKPASGDPIQMDRVRSGHAAIFSNYRRSAQGNITHICYWSSNQSGNGTGLIPESRHSSRPGPEEDGNRCEKIYKARGHRGNITNFSFTTGLGSVTQAQSVGEILGQ